MALTMMPAFSEPVPSAVTQGSSRGPLPRAVMQVSEAVRLTGRVRTQTFLVCPTQVFF